MKKYLGVLGVGAVLIVLFSFLVYPTLYRYDHSAYGSSNLPLVVKINRLTGNSQILIPYGTTSGWQTIEEK